MAGGKRHPQITQNFKTEFCGTRKVQQPCEKASAVSPVHHSGFVVTHGRFLTNIPGFQPAGAYPAHYNHPAAPGSRFARIMLKKNQDHTGRNAASLLPARGESLKERTTAQQRTDCRPAFCGRCGIAVSAGKPARPIRTPQKLKTH